MKPTQKTLKTLHELLEDLVYDKKYNEFAHEIYIEKELQACAVSQVEADMISPSEVSIKVTYSMVWNDFTEAQILRLIEKLKGILDIKEEC
jgi:hypothetical protein